MQCRKKFQIKIFTQCATDEPFGAVQPFQGIDFFLFRAHYADKYFGVFEVVGKLHLGDGGKAYPRVVQPFLDYLGYSFMNQFLNSMRTLKLHDNTAVSKISRSQGFCFTAGDLGQVHPVDSIDYLCHQPVHIRAIRPHSTDPDMEALQIILIPNFCNRHIKIILEPVFNGPDDPAFFF